MGRPKGLVLFLRQVWKYTFSPPALIDNQRVNEDQSLEEVTWNRKSQAQLQVQARVTAQARGVAQNHASAPCTKSCWTSVMFHAFILLNTLYSNVSWF